MTLQHHPILFLPEKADRAVLRDDKGGSVIRDRDAAERRSVPHAEALAIDLAEIAGTPPATLHLEGDGADRGVDDDLRAETQDVQIGAQHQRAVDAGEAGDEIGGVGQVLFRDERRVLQMPQAAAIVGRFLLTRTPARLDVLVTGVQKCDEAIGEKARVAADAEFHPYRE